MCLPFVEEFGWKPHVLAVAPAAGDHVDALLNETIPPGTHVCRVRGADARFTRPFGIGNPVLRAWPTLAITGRRLIKALDIDLVYFSTTMFLSMPLGRIWKRWLGTPYVLDMQDPWLSDYYESHPGAAAPPKYALARRVHAVLEPWTMRTVDGLVSVSEAYITQLRQRYPWLSERPALALPFGVASADYDFLDRQPQPNPFFRSGTGRHGVYVGAAGDVMRPALRALLGALRCGRDTEPRLFGDVHLHFIGTSYATDSRATPSVAPLTAELGLSDVVSEQTARAPYFQALQVLKEAQFLLIIGSDDPTYVASKLHVYALTGKPILAVVHHQSAMLPLLERAGAFIATFRDGASTEQQAVADVLCAWGELLRHAPARRPVPDEFQKYSARENAREQCALFDQVVGSEPRHA